MKIYTAPFSPSLKMCKTFKRMLSSTLNKKSREHLKKMFLDAEETQLRKAYIKPERNQDVE